MIRKEGLAHWKKISGYHRRSLAETAMYRFKQLLTGKISLRNYNGQVGEVMAYVSAINKLNTWAYLSESLECSGHPELGKSWLAGLFGKQRRL